MADNFPLLIFPTHKKIKPPKAIGFPPSETEKPEFTRQIERLKSKMQKIKSQFSKYKGIISLTTAGIEPECVLVIELADRIDKLQNALNSAGLEWLYEWDIDLESDDDFPSPGNTARKGRLFVSMANQQGMKELLSLWKKWSNNEPLPYGKKRWKNILSYLKDIRAWGIQETLIDTRMKEYIDRHSLDESIDFQIEFFYRQNPDKRKEIEEEIKKILNKHNGSIISRFIDMPDIRFHAVKANAPVELLKQWQALSKHDSDINLFNYSPVMYFYPAQNIISDNEQATGEPAEYPETDITEQNPVAAILDGVPNLQHKALKNRILFDDPFGLSEKYRDGERRHGTAMSSLIIHGDRSNHNAEPIRSQLCHIAVMQPDEKQTDREIRDECFPDRSFCEDRIEQAVLHIFGNQKIEALAPDVKIINISLGHSNRPFFYTLSPWARLLDLLSWKYKVLFCVSAGNYTEDYNFRISTDEYRNKSKAEKIKLFLSTVNKDLTNRRLISPAESINSLTIGALHQDESDFQPDRYRIDLLPSSDLPSPISRFGHGFRRSIKPEIYLPGGQQLYSPHPNGQFKIDKSRIPPGQKAAHDSAKEGELSSDAYSRGTSNAAALATRAGIQIHDVLNQLNNEAADKIPTHQMAVLIKTLLVHGSKQRADAMASLECLRNPSSNKGFKQILARYLGYGSLDIERVLHCTAQRGTVIGCGEINPALLDEYRFPIPAAFSGLRVFRRMTVTLAWFSPINPEHRYFREAKLQIESKEKWGDSPLKINRTHNDYHQVKRGTVQHEILEGKNQLKAFQQNEEIVLQVSCKADATNNLEENIPYGLAVTLEAAEESTIPVYENIKERLLAQVTIRG